MTNAFIDIVGKLPLGLVEMYRAEQEYTAQTETLVVGTPAWANTSRRNPVIFENEFYQ
ncbi:MULTISPECIES: hypothetical protein [Thalassolituus]|jgi:hypothetical protein|uniref:hypothetical protein n=1 Tax=Thalassolituus TaxID=187492 RepID=UPI001CE35A31|nr:hypothetical protein [Thalassolituus oleivorans]